MPLILLRLWTPRTISAMQAYGTWGCRRETGQIGYSGSFIKHYYYMPDTVLMCLTNIWGNKRQSKKQSLWCQITWVQILLLPLVWLEGLLHSDMIGTFCLWALHPGKGFVKGCSGVKREMEGLEMTGPGNRVCHMRHLPRDAKWRTEWDRLQP